MPEDHKNEAGLREIPASEILGKIQKGEPVEYKYVRIRGDLDLCKLDLSSQKLERTELEKQLSWAEDAKIVRSTIEITKSSIQGHVNFCNAIFIENVSFFGTIFNVYAEFDRATFRKSASFQDVTFNNGSTFGEVSFCNSNYFNGATFSGIAVFLRATFSRDAEFEGVTFSNIAWFDGATFSRDAEFEGATFSNSVWFYGATFSGEILTFKDANFIKPFSQEIACRMAKNVLEKNGDRVEAGYHFYREMDGKRKRKEWYIRYPEFVFVQLIFGYGVHPFRLFFCWFLVATIFAILYSANDGIISKLPTSSLPQPLSYFVECFYFSIVTAVTPGYGKYELSSWVYQVIASIEAIFGTFMWAAFIATFARKYMR